MPAGNPPLRTPIVAGNWKMNMTVAESIALVRALRDPLDSIGGAEKVVCPPFTSLVQVADLLRGTSVEVGAQNAFYETKGAYTGEVSPVMLAPLCRYVILGHSERRQYFGETNEIVNRKVRAVLAQGLKVIMCVGENLAQNEANETEAFVSRQVREGLQDVPALADIVIAYEPIWAIGTGKAATAAGAAEVIDLIRRTLRDMYGEEPAAGVRIQYGGSVTAANVRQFMEAPGIDGALVGGASLKADDFVAIVRQTAEAKA